MDSEALDQDIVAEEMDPENQEEEQEEEHSQSSEEKIDEAPKYRSYMIDRSLRGMQIYTKYLPKSTPEQKSSEPSANSLMIQRKLRGLQIYMKYLPEPIREETPELRESSSFKPLQNENHTPQERAVSNEKGDAVKKQPINEKNKTDLEKAYLQTPKLPFRRPIFTRKVATDEKKETSSQTSHALAQIKQPALQQTPTSKVKSKIRNLFHFSVEGAANPKPLFSQSPTTKAKGNDVQKITTSSTKNETSKRAQSSEKTRPDISFKFPIPLKPNTPANIRSRSTPKEDNRVAKPTQHNPSPIVRNRFITPIKSRNFSPRNSIDNSADLSRISIKSPAIQPEQNNQRFVFLNGGSTSFNFDLDRMAVTSSNFARRKLGNERQREEWIHANDLAQLAKKEKSFDFDSHLANFTTQYAKDIKNLMSGFVSDVRKQGLVSHYNIIPKSVERSSYGSYDLRPFTANSNYSRVSQIIPANSKNNSVMEGSEKENNDDFFIETDTGTPVEDSQRTSNNLGNENQEKPLIRKSTERSRAKSACKTRERLSPLN